MEDKASLANARDTAHSDRKEGIDNYSFSPAFVAWSFKVCDICLADSSSDPLMGGPPGSGGLWTRRGTPWTCPNPYGFLLLQIAPQRVRGKWLRGHRSTGRSMNGPPRLVVSFPLKVEHETAPVLETYRMRCMSMRVSSSPRVGVLNTTVNIAMSRANVTRSVGSVACCKRVQRGATIDDRWLCNKGWRSFHYHACFLLSLLCESHVLRNRVASARVSDP